MSLEKLERRDAIEAEIDLELACLHPPRSTDLGRLSRRLAAEIDEIGPPVIPSEYAQISLEQFEAAVGRAWLMGATVALNTVRGRDPCRVCGCWELQACEVGCGWSEPGLCTACDTGASDA